ncbi:MAG: hypothetical protein ACNA7J_14150, partial [Wenzhouxiangella sp.]
DAGLIGESPHPGLEQRQPTFVRAGIDEFGRTDSPLPGSMMREGRSKATVRDQSTDGQESPTGSQCHCAGNRANCADVPGRLNAA